MEAIPMTNCKAQYEAKTLGDNTHWFLQLTRCTAPAQENGYCKKHDPRKAMEARKRRIEKAKITIEIAKEEIQYFKKLLRK